MLHAVEIDTFRRAEPRKRPGENAHPHPAAYAARLADDCVNPDRVQYMFHSFPSSAWERPCGSSASHWNQNAPSPP